MNGETMTSDRVAGLCLVRGFLDVPEQATMLASIDAGVWDSRLKRRVQHFGHLYDYKARRVAPTSAAEPLPVWGLTLADSIISAGLAVGPFDQLIVNEYVPGQGISPHVDCVPCFGEEIVSVSLGSHCVMTFSRLADPDVDVLLEPGDLMVMRAAARFEWRHAIRARKSDTWDGRVRRRARRVSVTLRHVVP